MQKRSAVVVVQVRHLMMFLMNLSVHVERTRQKAFS